jgi:hypothetical protein
MLRRRGLRGVRIERAGSETGGFCMEYTVYAECEVVKVFWGLWMERRGLDGDGAVCVAR